eukprot:Skav222352  [mRNA]  locus=scaffold3497:181625:183579:+ [translate_table: standard]
MHEWHRREELDEMELPPQCHIEPGTRFPDKNNLMHFNITISPDEGFWKGQVLSRCFGPEDALRSEVDLDRLYFCETKIYHPNIDMQGNAGNPNVSRVCLNILREDWKPALALVLSISSVVYGLLYLFLEPNPGDPLNHEAAEARLLVRGGFSWVQRSKQVVEVVKNRGRMHGFGHEYAMKLL